jgi:hypothetical protein
MLKKEGAKLQTIVLLMLLVVSCTKQSVSLSNAISPASKSAAAKIKYSIGGFFGGGIIFYIDGSGQHGLIAYAQDFEEPSVWSYTPKVTGAKAAGINKGAVNTQKILQALGQGGNEAEDYAALEAAQWIANGYQDWYLPSIDELNELYKQKAAVGGLNARSYWSSTEVNGSAALFENFSNGTQVKASKSGSYALRVIRTF